MVIEDDAFLLPEGKDILQELVKTLQEQRDSWDMVLLSLSDKTANPSDAIRIKPYKDIGTIIPSKEGYFVQHNIVDQLLAETETIRFPMRIQLSYVIVNNTSMRVFYPTKRIVLDGSKLGLFCSSINPNNMLIYNREYMELWEFMKQDAGTLPVKQIRDLYKTVAHIQNPDIMHLYSVLLFKAGEVMEAQDVLSEAVQLAKKQFGVVTASSDMLNNLINMHEASQRDLVEALGKESKYCIKKKVQTP